jgi:hypothetical protein
VRKSAEKRLFSAEKNKNVYQAQTRLWSLFREKQKNVFYEKCHRVLEKCAQRLFLQDEEKCIFMKSAAALRKPGKSVPNGCFLQEAEKCILWKAPQRSRQVHRT